MKASGNTSGTNTGRASALLSQAVTTTTKPKRKSWIFFQTAVDMFKTLDSYHVRRIMKSGSIDRKRQKLTL